MIEFDVKVRVNTQDLEIAHAQLRAALSFSGMYAEIDGDWKLNNRPVLDDDVRNTVSKWSMEMGYQDKNVTVKI